MDSMSEKRLREARTNIEFVIDSDIMKTSLLTPEEKYPIISSFYRLMAMYEELGMDLVQADEIKKQRWEEKNKPYDRSVDSDGSLH